MELEQRVKTLEYEIKILKNEIQRTLLDIQEQVLIHYYPALRADENAPSDGTIQAVEALRAKQTAAPAAPPAPAVKKVSLDEVRAAQKPHAVAAPDPTSMVKMLEWVMNTAAKLGGERAARLITACGNKGILAPETRDALLPIAVLNRANAPEKVAANDVLAEVLKLDALLGRVVDPEEALALIAEAQLG